MRVNNLLLSVIFRSIFPCVYLIFSLLTLDGSVKDVEVLDYPPYDKTLVKTDEPDIDKFKQYETITNGMVHLVNTSLKYLRTTTTTYTDVLMGFSYKVNTT